MRKSFLGLTTALALGALALPSVAYAAHHGGGGGGGHVSSGIGGWGGDGMRAGSLGGGSFNAARGFSGKRSVVTGNFGGRNFGNTPSRQTFARANDGRRSAQNGHHFRHHRGFAGFIGGYGAYAAYDYCWNRVWTPYGYERVYVCGPYPYDYN